MIATDAKSLSLTVAIAIGLLDLGNNSLTGTIPTELGKLKELKCTYQTLFHSFLGMLLMDKLIPPPARPPTHSSVRLSLASNQIRGSIPTELGGLDNLSKSQACWKCCDKK